MKNAWLVRPFPHEKLRIEEFRSYGIIAIGWPCMGSLARMSRSDLKSRLAQPPYSYTSRAWGRAYATIDIFVNQMREGDLVLIPNGEDIHFGVITSDYYFVPQLDSYAEGYSHQRKVKWIVECARTDLSMDLRNSLKFHGAVANLSHHLEEMEAHCRGERPIVDTIAMKTSYPLRPNFTVEFQIPNNMTRDEAKRLGAYFASLYFEE